MNKHQVEPSACTNIRFIDEISIKLYYLSVILLHNLFLIIVKIVLYQYLLRNFDIVDSLVFLDRFV